MMRTRQKASALHEPTRPNDHDESGRSDAVRAARLACRLLDAPFAVVASVDGTAITLEWWPAPTASRDTVVAFCRRVIEQDALRVEPAIAPELGVRIGAPLGSGLTGALCVFGARGSFGGEERQDLLDLAVMAGNAMDRHREAAARMRAEEDVTAERGRLAAVIESLPFDFWVCDASGRYLLQNSYGRRLWADHTGLLPKETRAPAELQTHWTDTNRRALAGEIIHTEWSYDFAGKTVHVEEILAPIRNADGTIWGISGVNLDIGERKRAEMRLAEAEARLRAAIESLPFDFWVCDADGRYVMTNATCREHWGTYVGKRPLESGVEASISGQWERENRRVFAGETLRYETSYGAGDARREIEAIVAPVHSHGQIIGLVGVNIDITERKRSEERIRHLADHDPLTGLPNRRRFLDRLRHAVERVRRRDDCLALLLLDLDDLKVVNDTLGHDAGDALLGEVARRLQRGRRAEDTVARLGGDEFALIVEGLRQPDSAGLIARRILAELRQPCAVGEQDLPTSACIGLATFPGDAASAAELLKHADIALYRAKRAGRGQCRHFAAEMRAELDGRRQLDTELRRAVENYEFTVLYQPILEFSRPSRFSFEALLRWRHPDRGLLAPSEFLHLAEETGLIVPIGRTVLELVAGQARRWSDAGVPLGRMAINVADAQFAAGDLDEAIAAVLIESDTSSWQLEVEVTESVFVGRRAGLVEQLLQRLHRRGVSIALDDFGTGYASLTHLRRFPIDRLKIDRSFVRGILHSPNDATIVRTIIELGHSLDLEIVAEGVETREQLDFLRRHRCDHIQGYLIATPAPAEEALRQARRQAEHLLA